MKNHLDKALSPYLLQHKNNPVHWYSWCKLAFERAQKENKPIFLSIGYAACHWCHVMAHESFEDNKTAQFLNQHFISIKVDREEHPQIDKIYMDFVTKLYGQGGWPLNIFLTPDGKPFAGGTYFPNKPRLGLPSFLEIIENIVNIWQNNRAEIEESSNQIVEKIRSKLSLMTLDNALNFSELRRYLSDFKMNIDIHKGGMLGTAKFPQIPLWRWLFVLATYSHDTELLESCYLTANKLCQGGIYDHVGGGWMRYSTDENWLVPHFEKMLYDNALNITWLSELHVYRPNKIYQHHIEQTIQWLMRDMYLPEGLFASSLDADIDGVEGEFYLWSENEIKELLSHDFLDFKKCYGIMKSGNWNEKNILHRNHKASDQYSATHFTKALQILLDYRNRRGSISKDDKIITQWNAFLISALAKAGQNFQKDEWIELALKTYENLSNLMFKNGKWYHCYRNHQYSGPALLDDYAAIIDALLNLYIVTGDQNKLDKAIEILNHVNVAFKDKENHLYNQLSFEEDHFIANPQIVFDDAIPANNGLMVNNLARLHLLTGESEYGEQIISIRNTLTPYLKQANSYLLSSFCSAIATMDVGVVIKVDIERLDKSMSDILFAKRPPLAMILNEKRNTILICDQNKCIPMDNINQLEAILGKHLT